MHRSQKVWLQGSTSGLRGTLGSPLAATLGVGWSEEGAVPEGGVGPSGLSLSPLPVLPKSRTRSCSPERDGDGSKGDDDDGPPPSWSSFGDCKGNNEMHP